MIAPNAHQCSYCGADLQHLLLPETIADFFQARANASSERGEFGAALAEAERGLTYADSSELHLLAAILAKQLGRPERMRHHVAAIPVDDTLRNEAEWLLRSHQDRERALQEANRSAPAAQASYLPPMPEQSHTLLEELLGGHSPDYNPPKRTYAQAVASVAIVVVAITMVAASWWWIGPGTLPGSRAGEQGERTTAGLGSNSEGSASQATPLPVATQSADANGIAPNRGLAVTATPFLLPTPTPTPSIPANLVQAAAGTPELADSNPSHVVLVQSTSFDIRQYLRDKGEVELAQLTIDARIQESTLVLQGFVQLDLQRRQLIELARGVPGISQVNTIDLLLRPMPTYIVQEGDTLWSIVYNIYGTVDRLDEFAAYNRDVLPSPDAIKPGMQLKVLPVQ
jgi:nucleoid-associated protein YgaU